MLDLFGGSGSTLIAAKQTGRRAFLMELDPLYCDVIVQRWEQFTGQKAERISDRSNAPAVQAVEILLFEYFDRHSERTFGLCTPVSGAEK